MTCYWSSSETAWVLYVSASARLAASSDWEALRKGSIFVSSEPLFTTLCPGPKPDRMGSSGIYSGIGFCCVLHGVHTRNSTHLIFWQVQRRSKGRGPADAHQCLHLGTCDSSVLPRPHIVVQMTLTMAKIVFHPNNPVTLFSEDIDFTIFSHLLTACFRSGVSSPQTHLITIGTCDTQPSSARFEVVKHKKGPANLPADSVRV